MTNKRNYMENIKAPLTPEQKLMYAKEELSSGPYKMGKSEKLEYFIKTLAPANLGGATLTQLKWHEQHLGDRRPMYEGLFNLIEKSENEEDKKLFANTMTRILEIGDEESEKAAKHFS